VRKGGVGYFFGGYDVHADVLLGGYRLAKTTHEVLAFYKSIRRRYPDRLRIYLVNDILSLHWTPQIRTWAESHNLELVPTSTPSASSTASSVTPKFARVRGERLGLRHSCGAPFTTGTSATRFAGFLSITGWVAFLVFVGLVNWSDAAGCRARSHPSHSGLGRCGR
jgi:hypothetical protein